MSKSRRGGQLGRAKSCDCPSAAELAPTEVKILLQAHPEQGLQYAIAKQELLASRGLFDPFRYFGSPSFPTIEDAQRYHQPKLDAMFADCGGEERRTGRKVITLKGSVSQKGSLSVREESSPLLVGKKGGTRGGAVRSPKGCVRENKENYQRLNLNCLGRVRAKLRLSKRNE